jgi:L-seryl-tRNA(Ser) seleniumtransferase
VGTREAVARVRAHPFYRAIRCDKLTLVAMEAVLRLFLDPERLDEHHPTVSALTRAPDALADHARRLTDVLAALPCVQSGAVAVEAISCDDAVGAGSLPTVKLPGAAVRVQAPGVGASELARRLRAGPTPLFTTVRDEAVEIHVRTLLPGDDDDVAHALSAAFS